MKCDFVVSSICLFVIVAVVACAKQVEPKPLVDWSSVGPSVVVDDIPAEAEPIDSTEPPAASVPLGPGTDTVSVADETGRLPGDAGYKGVIEPPTKIYIVTSPDNCPPCRVMEGDNAPQELKNHWPSALVKIFPPNPGEVVPMLKIEHNGKWYYLPGFYPMPKTHPTKERRLKAMFDEIEKELSK